ncbi:MAG: TonB-dependent receptor [Bacteroidota bacterium]
MTDEQSIEYTGFTADYGNALSGVVDLKLRKGNADKREYLAQVGFNGFELGVEGPFKKDGKASYLANYRYSMLAVANALGLEFGTGAAVPFYQDLTFKVHVPTKKAGTFSLFGLGGLSNIEFLAETAGDNNLYSSDNENSRFRSNTGVTGLSHTFFLDNKTYSKLVLAVSGTQSAGHTDTLSPDTGEAFRSFGTNSVQIKYSLNYKLNRKFNARNTANVGFIADHYQISVLDSFRFSTGFEPLRDFDGNATMVQAYGQWKHRFTDKLSSTAGVHSQHFLLNGSHAVEPRLGLRYQLGDRQNLNFGAGLHSQLQPLMVYFVKERGSEEGDPLPNENLDFTRSMHLVLGHDLFLTPDMRLKSEIYYQQLYNVPIHSYASPFSMLNAGRDFILPTETDLVNEGTGVNYGLELTLEKFFSKGYYFLVTSSLFQSQYTGSDNIERNTAFNGNYVFNVLGGKEFKLGKRSTLGFDTKITYAGGMRFTPID